MEERIRSARMAGHVIRMERKKRGWSQSDLADRMNVRQGTVSKLETGGSVRSEILFSALSALGLDLKTVSRTTKADFGSLF